MERKCCSSGCQFSDGSEKQHAIIFEFSTDKEKKLCLRKLHRDNFTSNVTAGVWIKHFDERFVFREDRIKRNDGTKLVEPREKKKKNLRFMPILLLVKIFQHTWMNICLQNEKSQVNFEKKIKETDD